MRIYLTVLSALAICRFVALEARNPKPRIGAMLICIAAEVVGIVFIWML